MFFFLRQPISILRRFKPNLYQPMYSDQMLQYQKFFFGSNSKLKPILQNFKFKNQFQTKKLWKMCLVQKTFSWILGSRHFSLGFHFLRFLVFFRKDFENSWFEKCWEKSLTGLERDRASFLIISRARAFEIKPDFFKGYWGMNEIKEMIRSLFEWEGMARLTYRYTKYITTRLWW